MEIIEIILSTFSKHTYVKLFDTKFEKILPNNQHPYSSGIRFENESTIGEIFVYQADENYCEFDIVSKNSTHDYSGFIKEFNNLDEIPQIIENFLNKELTN